MPYVNLPANLQQMFQTIADRLRKLENSQRFTAPNVPPLMIAPTITGLLVTDPQTPRVGDIWLNTGSNEVRYVDAVGAAQAFGGGGSPTGSIIMFGSATPPSGWILCNGQSTAGYSALTAVVGSNVPDLRNNFVVGAGLTYSQNSTGGSPTHIHGLADGWAEIARRLGNIRMNLKNVPSWTATHENTAATNANQIAGAPATVLGGSTQSGSSLPPYYALTYIIKT